MAQHIVVTGGGSLLGRALVASQGTAGSVRRASEGDLRDEAFARQLVEDAEVLIHLAPLYPDVATGASPRDRLDLATRGTYVLLNAAVAAGVKRVVLGSCLDLLERYPRTWAVSEAWQPRPDVTNVSQLAVYLTEETAKQVARTEPLSIICLRFGTIVDDDVVAGKRYDPRWLHVDDAVEACHQAVQMSLASRGPGMTGSPHHGWSVYHIPGGGADTRIPLAGARGDEGLSYEPRHAFETSPRSDDATHEASTADASGDLAVLGPRVHIPSRPIRNVVIFGAGGPLAAATARVLASSYRLRLTDLRAIAEIEAENKPQSEGAPLPHVLGEPHETMQVDVTDLAQVMRACEGMDAIINCTVLRPHPVHAFLVNFLGAYNVMLAATTHAIRRVVHTGPQLVTMDRPAGYWWDFAVPDDAPPRAGTWLYGITKYLGQETVRLFAEEYDLEVPVLLYSSFVDPATAAPQAGGVFPMSVSWDDAGHAMRRALESPTLPSPFEIFHVLADLPMGKYSNAKAKRLLGWQPRDNLAHLWATRPA